jgi:hypothetical protein
VDAATEQDVRVTPSCRHRLSSRSPARHAAASALTRTGLDTRVSVELERSEEAFPQPGLSRPRVLWALRRDVTDSVKGVIAIVAMGLSARAVGRRVCGLSYYRRAATYYATAL